MSGDQFEFAIDVPPRLGTEDDLNALLLHMVHIGGSDAFIMGSDYIWVKRYSKMVRITKRRISDKEAFALVTVIYGVNAQAKIGDKSPINPSHEFKEELPGDEFLRHRFRVNAVGCIRNNRDSITITARTIPTTPPRASEIGVEKEIMEACTNYDKGLIMVVGATGSGKSTLLASILRERLEDPDGNRNLLTIEEPIEFVYDDVKRPSSIVTQMEVGKNLKSVSEGVVNTLRMAPTNILVGEARDYATIAASVESSNTGHGVFTTIHCNTAAETYARMIARYPDSLQGQAKIDIVQASNMIIAQKLLPSVDGKRVAIREYLIADQAIKDRLKATDNIATEAFKVVRDHGRPMTADIQAKYDEGLISPEVYDHAMSNYSVALD